jgi:hypothetical protein
LIDNFPVHRFAIQDGRVKEVFVTLAGENLTEVLDEPSSPRIAERLTSLGLFPATVSAEGGQFNGAPFPASATAEGAQFNVPPFPATAWAEGAQLNGRPSPSRRDALLGVQRVKTEGLRAFRNVVGCILCNELIDNFPVHRFAIQGGRVKEVFVTSAGGHLTEVLDEPSSPRIEERLTSLGLFPATASAEGRQLNGAPSLPEGYRGEVNLAMEDWTGQLARVLDRGFILTIDYGQLATDLYSLQNNQGTLVCYHRHVVSSDPYQHLGQQDITCQVDFTSLMRLGDRHGLATVGYALQSQFLTNLGFSSFIEALQTQSLSAARTALSRMAMMTLVDPDEYGDFKVLAQAKGYRLGMDLLGFARQGT